MGTHGNVRTEWLVTLVLVALVGMGGMRALGESYDGAIAGAGRGAYGGSGRGTHGMAVAAEAGTLGSVGKGADALREAEAAARSGGKLSARVVEGTLENVGRLAWSKKSIRTGVPDFVHEAPQMLRYADMKGGGLFFTTQEATARGIDGYFVPWRSTGPVDLTRFNSANTQTGGHAVAVSLKDFSGFRGKRTRRMRFVIEKVEANSHNVRRSTAVPQAGIPKVIGTDLLIKLPQETMASMADELDTNKRWHKVMKRGTVASNAGASFRSIFIDVADGSVVLTSEMKDGEAVRVIARTDGVVLKRPFPAVTPQP